MNYAVYNIALDIHKTGSQVALSMIRGENKRKIVISLMENGRPYKIAKGCIAIFTALKPDENFIYNDCEIDYENNLIIYNVTSQTTTAMGEVKCQIKLIGADGGLLFSPTFSLIVADTLYSEQPILASSEEFNFLTKFLADLQQKLANGEFKGAKGEKGEKGENGKDAVTDQTYNPESENAQSGKAVAKAVADKVTIYSGTEVSIANPGEGKVMTINKPSGSVTEPPLWNVKKGDLYLNEDENRLYLCVGSTKSGNILDLIWVGINYTEETSNKMDKFGEVLITEDEETELKYTTLEVPDFFTINTDAILTLNGNMIDLNPTCGMIYCSGAVLTNMGEPQSGGDAATKNYVDNLAGDVSTALDEIIELQNSIIGE